MDKLFGGIGFTLVLLGGGSMDSGDMTAPIVMLFVGLACLLVYARENGNFRKK